MACLRPERGLILQVLASLAFASVRARSESGADQQLRPSRPTHISALGRAAQDMVAVHMLKLYDKYNREGNRPRDGNTVRSFKATEGKGLTLAPIFPPEMLHLLFQFQFGLLSLTGVQ